MISWIELDMVRYDKLNRITKETPSINYNYLQINFWIDK